MAYVRETGTLSNIHPFKRTTRKILRVYYKYGDALTYRVLTAETSRSVMQSALDNKSNSSLYQ